MVNKIHSFEDIPVWKKAHELTLKIYLFTKKFPKEELYGLTSQIKRSSSSIPANIAEGIGKNTTKELINFLYNARGSCVETVYHLILAKDLSYVSKIDYQKLRFEYNNVGKQLNGWIRSLKLKS